MYSTGARTSLCGRGSKVPRMPWSLRRIRVLVLFTILLRVERSQSQQQQRHRNWRIERQHKGALVPSRFNRCIHTSTGAVANPVRESVEKRATQPDLRDIFLCHAWDDRREAAKDLHDRLESRGVSVWFSEKDVPLGTPLLREIDKGLAKSRVGIVLVTPALLRRVEGEGIADKELSALLARDLLVPIVHDTTYEALREVSPLLGSRSGLSTAEDTMATIAAKLTELVTVEQCPASVP